MTKKGIQKRKDFKLKKKGKDRPRSVKSPIISEKLVDAKKDKEITQKVNDWFKSADQKHKNNQTIKRFKKKYRKYNKPKTSEQWRMWYKYFDKIQVSYIEA